MTEKKKIAVGGKALLWNKQNLIDGWFMLREVCAGKNGLW